MLKLINFTTAALIGTALAGPAFAQDYGKHDGTTLRVKLIGGAQYEPLYTLIPKWEEETGGKVQILSRKNHFELDREMKQDIAAGKIDYCVFSNHTSFAPQYPSLSTPLNDLVPQDVLAEFSPLVLEHSTIEGDLIALPRHSDVSNMYYVKSLYEDEEYKTKFKDEYGYDLAPPETWDQAKDQALFFADPPARYGTLFAGKDEAITGRFYEMLVAEGGQLFDEDWNPTFNSEAGVKALNWFAELYQAGAVPAGSSNYVWDDVGLGFGAGNAAFDLDWAGWAAFFNGKDSKIADNVGIALAPKGDGGKRSGWSGSHTFSITEACDNREAAVSLITYLTSHDAQMLEARTGLLPTRTKVWDDITAEFKADGNEYMVQIFETYSKSMQEDAFTPPLIPEWIEVSNILWPKLQAAILGDMSAQEALDEAAEEVQYLMEDAGYL